jgi:hypothetical protein
VSGDPAEEPVYADPVPVGPEIKPEAASESLNAGAVD